ncbi:unnamed protein product [marine sediment metagenome]|uniref:Uncharacterized protein n=1 Tax=marine sediment metagenome TaxID=412755 RepID=X0WC29_9ZZZZ
MSLLGKYRRDEADKDDDETTTVRREPHDPTKPKTSELQSAVPNKERKSPIVSFSIPTDLRACLQAIRKTKAINLSLWVEYQLRDAISKEFPQIAEEYLE